MTTHRSGFKTGLPPPGPFEDEEGGMVGGKPSGKHEIGGDRRCEQTEFERMQSDSVTTPLPPPLPPDPNADSYLHPNADTQTRLSSLQSAAAPPKGPGTDDLLEMEPFLVSLGRHDYHLCQKSI